MELPFDLAGVAASAALSQAAGLNTGHFDSCELAVADSSKAGRVGGARVDQQA